MNLAARRSQRLSAADFIEMIRPYPDEERWELLDGEPVLMAPQSERHQTLVANLLRALGPAADARDCRILPGLGILNDAVDDYAPIPDLVVRCGPPLPGGYAKDPVLIAEVLSPTTRNNDRGRKADFYETLPTLRTFMIVHQDEVRIEAWQREGEAWRVRTYREGDGIDLRELATTLPLDAVYAGVRPFDSA
jgi:Uma2 family endonuclease